MEAESDRLEDEWEFYPCLADDLPASILLNLRYERDEDARRRATLAWVTIEMLDAEEHGMGSADEAEALYPVEEAIVEAASSRGLVHVGRLRNAGTWQLAFYGPPDAPNILAALVEQVELRGRSAEIGGHDDPDWRYYDEFLLPDPERRQWIHDLRLIETLEEHGDDLRPRPVNHWAYFPTAAARDAFVAAVRELGFRLENGSEGSVEPMPFGANVVREDSVELDDIHEVVVTLIELAERHGGDYDGWETVHSSG